MVAKTRIKEVFLLILKPYKYVAYFHNLAFWNTPRKNIFLVSAQFFPN